MSDYNGFGGGDDNDDDTYEEVSLDDLLFGNQPDSHALDLMFDAIEAGRDSPAWSEFGDYLWDFYSIDLNSEWDWVDFREWYDSQ